MSVDVVAKRRGEEWTQAIGALMCKNDLHDPEDLLGLSTEGLDKGDLPEVKMAVVRRACDRVTKECEDSAGAHSPGSVSADNALNEIAKALGKNQPEKLAVDVGPQLKNAGLSNLHMDLWPRAASVNALATEGQKQRKSGVVTPFVHADLTKFVPLWMADDACVMEGDEDDVAMKAKMRPMSVAQWAVAFDAYALAAAVTEQWDYAASYERYIHAYQIIQRMCSLIDAPTWFLAPRISSVRKR
jgi:hypothetical protein